ncbi:MAG TPA: fumarylacetoacetate hydrolase family protein [Gammaproteobacteria bacterium]|jgi:2-oxo-3-hexenedioate decarboxylase|nr:fumarylacetoacetate hydrolase family protein [Gammaproteobacteria bacterium]
MNNSLITHLAEELDSHLKSRTTLATITSQHPDLTIEDAYEIQKQGVLLRELRGEKIVGYKMGLTSVAKQQQMNITAPISGVLTDKMQVQNDREILLKNYIQPKAEMEIAFITNMDLRGNVSAEEVLHACGGVCAAIEIIDSRFIDFKFKLIDVIADNCSASGFVLGTIIKPDTIQFDNLDMNFSVNDTVIEHGNSHSVSGNPINSLVMLIKHLDKEGSYLKAGSIVLTGTPTNAITLKSGQHLVNNTGKIGKVSLRVTSGE